jgi:hypothetical protein
MDPPDLDPQAIGLPNDLTEREKATIELYRLLYYKKDKTTLDDIKKVIEKGAYLNNINSIYGMPLLYAIDQFCHPDIIQYLKDKGGTDNKCVTSSVQNLYNYEYKKGTFVDINFIQYHSVKNSLLENYNYLEGTKRLENHIIYLYYTNIKVDKECYTYEKIIKKYGFEKNVWDKNDYEIIQQKIQYLKEYCKILDYNYSNLENEFLDLPEDYINDYSDLADYYGIYSEFMDL